MKLRHGLRLNTNLKTKIDYIKDFVENTNDNIIIFYNYDEELKLLQENISKKIYLCNGAVKDYPKKSEWDSIKNTVTLANYKSGSEAVEFTYANIIVYFSPTESYTEFYQSYGRCYRNGQNKKVTAYKFITDNTIEADIYKALDNKEDFNAKLWLEKENLWTKI
jgi:superfamily II DNA or RNA helicase